MGEPDWTSERLSDGIHTIPIAGEIWGNGITTRIVLAAKNNWVGYADSAGVSHLISLREFNGWLDQGHYLLGTWVIESDKKRQCPED